MLDMIDTLDEVAPTKSRSHQSLKEHRSEIRYKANWRVAIAAIERGNLIYGRIRDISLNGAAILNELNIKPGTSVTLKIFIPTFISPSEPKILVVHGTTSYSVHDADHFCFRSGIAFAKFELATDRAFLQDHLANYNIRMPDQVRQRSSDAPISRFSAG